MRTMKRTALAAVTVTLACVPLTPAAAAGPLLLPWAVGHVIGAAARLATLPLAVASAASASAPPAYAAGPAYAAASGYNTVPGAYYASPGYYRQPGGYARYYAAPAPYYFAPRYSAAAPIYRSAAFSGPWARFPDSRRGYSAPGMRYAGAYGGQHFGRSRGFSYRR
jgi:hypothetical protein